VNAQLDILLRTIKENNFQSQAERIRKLIDEHGMEVFETYFRRMLNNCWSLVFPNAPRPGANNAESYQLLVQEMHKLSTDPQQAEKIAQALDSSDWDVDLAGLVNHFQLEPVAKTALVSACRSAAKPELRSRGKQPKHPTPHFS
jgi:CCR4-NOT transcription complex subunit 1